MSLSPSQAVSRSNTDLLNIELILQDHDLSVLLRMALIEELVEGWGNAVGPIRARHRGEGGLTFAEYLKNRNARAQREQDDTRECGGCEDPEQHPHAFDCEVQR